MTTPDANPPPTSSTVTVMALAGMASPLFLAALSAGFAFTGSDRVVALAFGLAAIFEPMGMWTVQVVMRQRAYDGQAGDLDGYTPPAADRPRFSPVFFALVAAGGLAGIGLFAVGVLLSQSGSPGADAPLFGLWLVAGIGTALYALAALRPVDSG